jgi:hypothetical protein
MILVELWAMILPVPLEQGPKTSCCRHHISLKIRLPSFSAED